MSEKLSVIADVICLDIKVLLLTIYLFINSLRSIKLLTYEYLILETYYL